MAPSHITKMRILKRFTVFRAVVSVLEDDVAEQIEVEICGADSPEQEKAVRDYLLEEGIFHAILSGKEGLAFDAVEVERYFFK